MRGALAPIGIALAIVLSLAGCSISKDAPEPVASPSGSASPTAAPDVKPTLNPSGSATDNKAYFDYINGQVLAANGSAGGRDFIDALVAAGFDKSAMQVTQDRTSVDLQADSIQFSIVFAGQCLIGQSGITGYVSTVDPLLSGGKCLIGQTRSIDW
jgi:hypothetical protein